MWVLDVCVYTCVFGAHVLNDSHIDSNVNGSACVEPTRIVLAHSGVQRRLRYTVYKEAPIQVGGVKN